ncbi:DUF3237 domain-containing protein [Aurantiacibacter poecillastricola]|uniref:DUF3237 domain-containing protein n=1 Tax=Aurantiacibacter poecillastricola TaxID=3064385 RepID=UPI00273D0042|nr:DUF3237 domain-containing protein [Aurantiacibacter sp. 219JJ12-13]MDP5261788.1 DUF3237 domain-containing protein [Aurantiacibacter sp. 219JJ12-13]
MRQFIAATIAMLLPAAAAAQDAPSPPPAPGLELLYRSVVTLGEVIEVGKTPRGVRRIIPITGGTFEGPEMRGEILPMGWDWQLDRSDGCSDIVADYFLRTEGGVVINVVNTGTLCMPTPGEAPPPPARTSPVFEAPLGDYDWLTRGAYVGTLGFDPSVGQPHVVITVYRAN